MEQWTRCKDCGSKITCHKGRQTSSARCSKCSELAQARYNDIYFGWESTMGCPNIVKRGHRRVRYPFHVVGGYR